MPITPEQYTTLMSPLRGSRVAKRRQGGKELSYLEAWEVKAHLIRLFGFGNFDSELLDYGHIATREYENDGKQMVEVIYRARVQVTIRDDQGNTICRYTEGACGSTSGPEYLLGEHHDNALKTAESDAFKRCCIYLGSQFGLSLYDDGTLIEVVKKTIIHPEVTAPEPTDELTDEQKANLEHSLGATEVTEEAS